MLLPLGTDRARKRPTLVTFWLIGVCTGVFAAQMALRQWAPDLDVRFESALMFDPQAPTVLGLFGYQFLHANLLHLLGNMLFLWVFGPLVEDRFSRIGFAAFYLVGGMAAGCVHWLSSNAPVIGASGAISGVTGAFLVLFPLTHVRVLLFFFLIGMYQIPSWWFIAFAVVKDLYSAARGGGEQIAFMAHLGGYAYGAGIALVLLWRHVIPREPYDLFSMGRQAHRRRQFREISRKQGGASAWTSDITPVKKIAKRGKPTQDEEDSARRRQEIHGALARGDVDGAARRYLELLGRHSDAGLARDAQLSIANHLFSSGDHANAAAAYEIFLKRHREDREADNIRLMLALVCARYLNDPVRAGELLTALKLNRLDEEHRALAESLRAEIGETSRPRD